MHLPKPSTFNSELTDERLEVISKFLVEELFATEDDLERQSDDGSTRGCTTFGRQKNRIKHEALSGKYDWLTLMNGANDLVFAIGGVPCRFSNDDPSNPSKVAAIAVNRYQIPFLEFVQPGEPGRFCFIVDKGQSEIEEPRVEFLGYGPSGELACRWISNSIRVLREVDAELPSPVEVSKPSIMPKQDQHSTQIKKSLS
ncbi:MAG: hypothetical protein ACK51V_00705 [bacterium]